KMWAGQRSVPWRKRVILRGCAKRGGPRSDPLRSRDIAAGARLHAEISPPYPLIGHESGVRALQHDRAGFEHIAVIAGFERFGHALLDKEQGHAALAV